MAEIRRERNDKMRQGAVDIAMAACDIIDAVKKFDEVINNCEEVNPGTRIFITESMREMIVQLMYGENAYVVTPFNYRKPPYEKFKRPYNTYGSYKERYNPDNRIDPSEYEHPEED